MKRSLLNALVLAGWAGSSTFPLPDPPAPKPPMTKLDHILARAAKMGMKVTIQEWPIGRRNRER